MKTRLLLVLTSLLFMACSETPIETKTVINAPIQSIPTAKETVQTINVKTEVKPTTLTKSTPSNGAHLYAQKCASCHGKNAKKSALNASDAIAGWDSSKIQKALKGYQDGSYGRKMKSIMQGQSKPLSDSDIKQISDYLSIL